MENTIADYIHYQVDESPLNVEKIHILTGANYFSAGPVVLIRLNLGKYNEVFTNQIEAFPEKLEKLLPSLYEHHCSVGKPGGFFLRVHEGTLLGHVIEHVAIELQTLAGMDVGYGKTRSTLTEGVYNIIFRFFDEVAGIYAGKAAVNLVSSIINNQHFDVDQIVKNLVDIGEKRLLGPSTQAIVSEAEKRKIPWMRLDRYNLVQLGTGKYHKTIRATITSDTNFIAIETSDNKFLTNLMLRDAGIPVPLAKRTESVEDAIAFVRELNVPVVIKPCEGSRGKKLSINIISNEEIISACKPIIESRDEILIQPYCHGKSYRLLVIDFKFVAATLLTPPSVTGNGKDTIQKLIVELNKLPERQTGDKGLLSLVETDEDTLRILALKNYALDTILNQDEIIYLKNSGNLRLGGYATDVTDMVHKDIVFIAERAARTIGLNVAGIDIISKDIALPLNENNGVVIEVNAAPDFRMHLKPYIGISRNVAENMLEMLFPTMQPVKIPLISITGSIGKTTAANFLKYCFKQQGNLIGMASSNGIFIDDQRICDADLTKPNYVALVLKDSSIDFAILETSCESILAKGLGYEFADIGVFLNVTNEHTGTNDIKYIEDMAYAKSVVAEQVYEYGFSVLNADSVEVLEVIPRLYSKPVLFSAFGNNPEILSAIAKGQTVVYIENLNVVSLHRSAKQIILALDEIPVHFKNPDHTIYDSLLASIAVLIVSGIDIEKIRMYIKEFKYC